MKFLITIMLIVAATGFAGRSSAQPGQTSTTDDRKKLRHEISSGYGRLTAIQSLSGVYGDPASHDDFPVDRSAGVLFLTYRYYVGRRLFIGLGAGYESHSGSWDVRNSYSTYSSIGVFNRHVFSLAPEIGYCYSETRHLSMVAYCYASIGICYLNEVREFDSTHYINNYSNGKNGLGDYLQVSNSYSQVGFQVCPIGVSFGNKFRGFAELGLGYKGLFNLGAAIKL